MEKEDLILRKYGQVIKRGRTLVEPYFCRTIKDINGVPTSYDIYLCPLYRAIKDKLEFLKSNYKRIAKEEGMSYKETFSFGIIHIEIR